MFNSRHVINRFLRIDLQGESFILTIAKEPLWPYNEGVAQ
jgi:hypothetical protein